jgi:hypothetical protein
VSVLPQEYRDLLEVAGDAGLFALPARDGDGAGMRPKTG